MNEALKQKYKESSNKFKKSLSEIANASVLRKYRLIKKKKKKMHGDAKYCNKNSTESFDQKKKT